MSFSFLSMGRGSSPSDTLLFHAEARFIYGQGFVYGRGYSLGTERAC